MKVGVPFAVSGLFEAVLVKAAILRGLARRFWALLARFVVCV